MCVFVCECVCVKVKSEELESLECKLGLCKDKGGPVLLEMSCCHHEVSVSCVCVFMFTPLCVCERENVCISM